MHNVPFATPFISVVWWNGGSRQNVMPEPHGVIDIVANRIPELWCILPFVNKPRLFSLHKFSYIHGSLCEITVTSNWVRHIQNTLGLLFTGGRFAAPFRPLDKNST